MSSNQVMKINSPVLLEQKQRRKQEQMWHKKTKAVRKMLKNNGYSLLAVGGWGYGWCWVMGHCQQELKSSLSNCGPNLVLEIQGETLIQSAFTFQ